MKRLLHVALLTCIAGGHALADVPPPAPPEILPAPAPTPVAPEDAPPNPAPPNPAPVAPDDAPAIPAPGTPSVPSAASPDAPPIAAPVAPQPVAPDSTAGAAADSDADAEEESESAASTLPDAHRPELEAVLDPQSGLVTGDITTLRITATHPSGDDLTISPDIDFQPSEMLDSRVRSQTNGDRTTTIFELDLLVLQPGPTEIPPVAVRVITSDGEIGEVETDSIQIEVGSVLGNEPDAEPRDVTEPVEVWEDDYTLAWVGGGLLALLLTVLLTLLIARWWRKRAPEKPAPPPAPPWEEAIGKLRKLHSSLHREVEDGRVVEWVDGVSDTVREYLGRRYGFVGLESTTDEVIEELGSRKLIGTSKDEVGAILRDCDLVKFAKAEFDEEQCEKLLGGAIRVVQRTAPSAHNTPAAGPRPQPAPIPKSVPKAPSPTAPKVVHHGAPNPRPEPSSKGEASVLNAPADAPIENRWVPQTRPGVEPAGAEASVPPAEIPVTLPPRRSDVEARATAPGVGPDAARLNEGEPSGIGASTSSSSPIPETAVSAELSEVAKAAASSSEQRLSPTRPSDRSTMPGVGEDAPKPAGADSTFIEGSADGTLSRALREQREKQAASRLDETLRKFPSAAGIEDEPNRSAETEGEGDES